MGKYSKIPQDTFDRVQFDAGMILSKFDVTGETPVSDEDIVCATSGGITITATPSFEDLGADVDNCPNNMKELKIITGWEVKMSFTAIDTSPEALKLALGCADNDDGHITLRNKLETTDFADVWFVGDRMDGGFMAAHMMNALATSGLSIKTTKQGKGTFSVELTGHYSMAAQDTVPMEFYVEEA